MRRLVPLGLVAVVTLATGCATASGDTAQRSIDAVEPVATTAAPATTTTTAPGVTCTEPRASLRPSQLYAPRRDADRVDHAHDPGLRQADRRHRREHRRARRTRSDDGRDPRARGRPRPRDRTGDHRRSGRCRVQDRRHRREERRRRATARSTSPRARTRCRAIGGTKCRSALSTSPRRTSSWCAPTPRSRGPATSRGTRCV